MNNRILIERRMCMFRKTSNVLMSDYCLFVGLYSQGVEYWIKSDPWMSDYTWAPLYKIVQLTKQYLPSCYPCDLSTLS